VKIKDNYLIKILDKLIENNTQPILVGGCVRDSFLGKEVKDYDVEVYGLDSLETLEKILEEFGEINFVGKSFGILKLSTKEMEYDFSFPRLENKTSKGHRGFDVIIDSSLSFDVASKRRDFTINAIGYDYRNKIYLDPFDGIKDIEKKTLRYINDVTFKEDPLRVYRAIQLSARFDFSLDTQTFILCKKIVLTQEFLDISKERVYEEYKKFLLKSKTPSIGFTLLNELQIEKVDNHIISLIDDLSSKTMSNENKLLLIFSLIEDIFKKISNDKKLLKKINTFNIFMIPRIYKNKFTNIHLISEKMRIKLEIFNNMPKPLFMGKDLIKMGYKPSEKFKSILDTLYKMQLGGKIC